MIGFDEVTFDELLYAIQKLPNKQCEHDSIPTWLLKKIATTVAPSILSIFNLFFATGKVQCQFKHAYVTPFLKKSDLDQETLSSYRPISNLSVFSKLLERIVLPRIVIYLNNKNLLPSFQSAYRRHHSTETALLKVFTDILEAADNKKISLLVLLDLLSAFDLIDHQILIRRLNESFGLNDLTFEWFRNYLFNRSFNVKCPKTELTQNVYPTGVPQGSVLGPLLFTLYTADLEKIAASYNLTIRQYADDTQLYGHCPFDSLR